MEVVCFDRSGMRFSEIAFEDNDTVSEILRELLSLEYIGKTEEQLSDEPFTKEGSVPKTVKRGTVWIETGDKIYRISPEFDSICTVQSHCGKEKILNA